MQHKSTAATGISTVRRNMKFIVLIGVLGLLLQACDKQKNTLTDKRLSDKELFQHSRQHEESDVLMFGFDVRASLKEDARQYLPFLAYLEKTTGYRFKIRFTPKDGRIVDDLGKGLVHFAAIGATSYIQAANKYGIKPLVHGLNKKGKAEYRSYLIVKKNSPIKTLDDLHGVRFAFGSRTSTQGHLIPRIIMQKHQLQLQDFKSYIFTGSHQRCADAVISDKADVCGMQDLMAERLAKQGDVRILFRSEYYPSSGIAASNKVPNHIINKVRQALLDFKPNGEHSEGLYNWDKTEMPNGFINSRDSDYKILREWMNKLNISQTPYFSRLGGKLL